MTFSGSAAARFRRGLGALVALLLVGPGCNPGGTERSPDAGPPDADETSVLDTGVGDAPHDGDRTDEDGDDREPADVDVSPWEVGPGEDTTPPPLSLSGITPPRGPAGERTKFVLAGRGFTGETAVYFGGRRADVRRSGDDLVGQTPPLPNPGTVPVKAHDPETGTDVLNQGFTYTQRLELQKATPSSIPVDGGVQVTLHGSGFTSATRVSFDGETALQHDFVGASTLRVVAPPHPAGPADVRLTNRSDTVQIPDAVTYFQPLELDEVRPAVGSTAGGTTATLRGRGFSSGMAVTFGGGRATLQSVGSNGTRATVVVPPHAAGLVDVAVSTNSGGGDLARDAYYYRSSAGAFDLAALHPDHGARSGGTRVRLVGAGLAASGLNVQFDGNPATVNRQGSGWAVVSTPAHAPGTVDVTIRNGAGETSTLKGAYTYHRDLSIGGVQPATGPAAGGTTVTIRGSGFRNASKVMVGDVRASFTVKNDTTIEATTPSHAPGTFDVTVVRGELETTADDAFTFEESLGIYGFTPARGSIAGNTYVLVRGTGFLRSNLDVTFGTKSARSLERLDAHTLAVRTPAHSTGDVEVRARRGGTSARGPTPFHYFNPTARDGGTWGGSVEGSVNVSVYSRDRGPIPGAFVMLSTNPNSSYTRWTDRDGLATLSGPDVFGPQTITVTARGFSSVTLQRLDASNVTVYLNRVPVPTNPNPGDTGVTDTSSPPRDAALDVPDIDTSDADVDTDRDVPTWDSGTTPNPPIDASHDVIQGPDDPPPPDKKRPVFTGKLTGLDKIAVVGPNERTAAMVYTTKERRRGRNPPYGRGNRLYSDGAYRLMSRTGDLALVAVGGVLDTKTSEFEPHRMGVVRYQTAVRGKTYKRDIHLGIPLDQTLTFKISHPPFDPPDGPDVNFIHPYLDFGLEGYFGRLGFARGTSKLTTAEHFPKLQGKLSGVEIATIGGSYTERRGGSLVFPQSVALDSGITKIGTTIRYPSLIGVPKITRPPAGRRVRNRVIGFDLTSRTEPDFYQLQFVQRQSGKVTWEMFAPGSARKIQLPRFPDFSSQPKSRRPVPYPKGRYFVRVFAIRHPGASYEEFGYSDLSLFQWSAYAMSTHHLRF